MFNTWSLILLLVPENIGIKPSHIDQKKYFDPWKYFNLTYTGEKYFLHIYMRSLKYFEPSREGCEIFWYYISGMKNISILHMSGVKHFYPTYEGCEIFLSYIWGVWNILILHMRGVKYFYATYMMSVKYSYLILWGVWNQFLLWVSLAPGAKFSSDLSDQNFFYGDIATSLD